MSDSFHTLRRRDEEPSDAPRRGPGPQALVPHPLGQSLALAAPRRLFVARLSAFRRPLRARPRARAGEGGHASRRRCRPPRLRGPLRRKGFPTRVRRSFRPPAGSKRTRCPISRDHALRRSGRIGSTCYEGQAGGGGSAARPHGGRGCGARPPHGASGPRRGGSRTGTCPCGTDGGGRRPSPGWSRESSPPALRLAELRDLSDRLKQGGAQGFPAKARSPRRACGSKPRRPWPKRRSRAKPELEAMLRRADSGARGGRGGGRAGPARTLRARNWRWSGPASSARSPAASRGEGGGGGGLHVAPGQKRMLAMDELESATIATLYRPDSLQARIDVPLEEAAQLEHRPTPCGFARSLLPDRSFRGRVTRIDGQADMQRNTLQAKVALLDPDDQLRPEMLCRAEFLAPTGAGERSGGILRPCGALPSGSRALAGSGRERRVWALDASGDRVEQRSVTVGAEEREGHLRVLEGLRSRRLGGGESPGRSRSGRPGQGPRNRRKERTMSDQRSLHPVPRAVQDLPKGARSR